MTAWTAFASVAGVVTVLLLLLSHASSQRFGDSVDRGDARSRSRFVDDGDVDASGVGVREDGDVDATDGAGDDRNELDVDGRDDVPLGGSRERTVARESSGASTLSQPMLLANVAVSQGAFAVALVVAAVLADVPPGALGVAPAQRSTWFLFVGFALGVGLYVANDAGSRIVDAAGLGRSEALREFLAPDSTLGWVVLLGGVLPIVAGFEELLFRGVLVGALATGFGVSPWVLVVASSVLFGLGHGAQGTLGVLVTGALGVVLATAFVLTGSLLVVVVAHYLVNALEFVVHEGLDVD